MLRSFILVAALAFGVLAFEPVPVNAGALELSSQDRYLTVKPRARLRVTPRYPRQNFNTPYPLPDGANWPGPNAVRQCDFRLVQEHRPSGTVIVPRQRCWWVQRY